MVVIYNFKLFFFLFTLFSFYFNQINGYLTQNMGYVTNDYFRSGSIKIINYTISQLSRREFTIIFKKQFLKPPMMAYGLKTYRGYDLMNNFTYQMKISYINPTKFNLLFQLLDKTRAYSIQIAYFATDSDFPYSINLFHDVPLNYSSGPLTAFLTISNTNENITQLINFTSQSGSSLYRTFNGTLSDHKLAVYLNSISYRRAPTLTSNGWLVIIPSILNSSHYQIYCSHTHAGDIYKLQMSIIIYDITVTNTTNKFILKHTFFQPVYFQVTNFCKQASLNSLMLGLRDFRLHNQGKGQVMEYNWEYRQTNERISLSAIYIISQPSIKTLYNALYQARSDLILIQTRQCLSPYTIYNSTTGLCQNGCPDYFISNLNTNTCENCYYNCMQCSLSLSSNNCTKCQVVANRTLVNSSCLCSDGYFDDGYNILCRTCSDVVPNCISCTFALSSPVNSTYYSNFFANINWKTNILSNFSCLNCKWNYFRVSNNSCVTCSITYCVECQSPIQCLRCDSNVSAVKYTDSKCYLCTIANCILCSANNVCVACAIKYSVINNKCTLCNISCTCQGYLLPKLLNGSCNTKCGDIFQAGLQQCDDGNIFNNDGCSSNCTIQPYSISCLGDGWYKPYKNNACQTLCGDGLKRGKQQCDDNNTENNDGCSSTCLIQLPLIPQNVQQKLYLSQIPSLILFVFGLTFRGMQLMNIVQFMQLLFIQNQNQKFQISYYIHGISQKKFFPIQIKNQKSFFSLFNFMFFIIILILGLLIILKSFKKILDKKQIDFKEIKKKRLLQLTDNEITNKQQLTGNNYQLKIEDVMSGNQINQNNYINEQNNKTLKSFENNKLNLINIKLNQTNNKVIQNQGLIIQSNNKKDLTSKTIPINNINLSQTYETIQSKKLIESKKPFQHTNNFNSFCNIDLIIWIFSCIFIYLTINTISIFFYSITRQLKHLSFDSFQNQQTIMINLTMFGIYFGIFVYVFTYQQLLGITDKLQKQNQLKYWTILMVQKIIFSIIVNYNQPWSFCIIFVVRTLIFLFYLKTQIYSIRMQKLRSIILQFVHSFLLCTFIIEYFYTNKFKNTSLINKNDIYFYLYLIFMIISVIFTVSYFIQQQYRIIKQKFKKIKMNNKINNDNKKKDKKQKQKKNKIEKQKKKNFNKKKVKNQKITKKIQIQNQNKNKIKNQKKQPPKLQSDKKKINIQNNDEIQKKQNNKLLQKLQQQQIQSQYIQSQINNPKQQQQQQYQEQHQYNNISGNQIEDQISDDDDFNIKTSYHKKNNSNLFESVKSIKNNHVKSYYK